jgi:hypothetical protein
MVGRVGGASLRFAPWGGSKSYRRLQSRSPADLRERDPAIDLHLPIRVDFHLSHPYVQERFIPVGAVAAKLSARGAAGGGADFDKSVPNRNVVALRGCRGGSRRRGARAAEGAQGARAALPRTCAASPFEEATAADKFRVLSCWESWVGHRSDHQYGQTHGAVPRAKASRDPECEQSAQVTLDMEVHEESSRAKRGAHLLGPAAVDEGPIN